ncbi:MAG: hypothetical protein KZQ70_12335, partial [gamma proteobacterium symbiont of Lucinoma myriamae]|nr:hypothetical protein [gamma proteobacterium symbiont of Lucinoma myriamae]
NNMLIEAIPIQDLLLSINDQLFFEVLLMEIRGKSISYSSYLKKREDKTEKNLLQDIENIEKELQTNHELLDLKKKELSDIRRKKMEGVKVRSRAKWVDEGEKVTNYFCNLENRNFISKCMTQLISNKGKIIKEQNEIINETAEFYKNLYACKGTEEINLSEELNDIFVPKLSLEETNSLEGPIIYSEMLTALKHMANDKSPGSDGFSANFYKFFWRDIGYFLIRSLNYGFSLGELSVSQKQGVITCIPKGDKDKLYLKNWRPISLLNTAYKLASACIANRIKTVLPNIINEDQTGFISGRFIGENIRTLYDIMHFTEKYKIPGLLLLIDFEKAFDSVSWIFIDGVLDFFNLGSCIKNWIKVFYSNIVSCVYVNGQLSQSFSIYRGCRQGDPLSPYIFLMCAEILAILVRNNPYIKGIRVNEEEFRISQYADDTSLLLDGTEASLINSLKILKFYARISGLCINMEKTKVVWLGSRKGSTLKLCESENLCWESDNFTVLGIKFTTNLNDMVKLNYLPKLEDIKKLLSIWSRRLLTPIGYITVIKSLAISKIVNLISSLPNPGSEIISELNKIFFKFIWKEKPDKIKRKILIQDYKDGGLRMVDVENFVNALKVSWIRRMITENKKYLKIFQTMYPMFKDFQNYGESFFVQNIHKISNPFWKDVFSSYKYFLSKTAPQNWTEFLAQPLWLNKSIKVGGSSIAYKLWIKKGILVINDLMNSNGNLLSYIDFDTKFRVRSNFLEYEGVLEGIRSYLNKLNFQHLPSNLIQPIIPGPISILLRNKKGCRQIYDSLIRPNSPPRSTQKWQEKLNLSIHFQWSKIWQLTKTFTHDTTLIWFQTKINHRILATNYLLEKMKIVNNKSCSFCSEEDETIIHLLCSCRYVDCFWKNLLFYINHKCITTFTLWTEKEILFGLDKSDTVLNKIILQAKYYIYKSKLNNHHPLLNQFKKQILYLYKTEKYIAFKNLKSESFFKDWQKYKNLVVIEDRQ